jgi:hypothetical protein
VREGWAFEGIPLVFGWWGEFFGVNFWWRNWGVNGMCIVKQNEAKIQVVAQNVGEGAVMHESSSYSKYLKYRHSCY